MNFFRDLARAVLPHASAWRLGTSRSAEVTGGTPIARLYIAASAGTLYMGMGDRDIYIPYPYVGGGGGAGLGFSPPVSGSFSTRDFESTGGEWGRVYVPPGVINTADLDRDTISGPATLINPGVQLGLVGGGFSIIVFGITPASMNVVNPYAMFSQTRGVVFQAGLSATLGFGVSCSLHALAVLPPMPMEKGTPIASSGGFAKHLR